MAEIPVFEEHGEVLSYWHAEGWKDVTLLYFDQHLDFKAIAPAKLARLEGRASPELADLCRKLPFQHDAEFSYGLDDFLAAAAHLHILKRVIWFVPGHLDVKGLLDVLVKNLKLVPDPAGELAASLSATEFGAICRIHGLEIWATNLDLCAHLPLAGMNLKLDIDLDYFVVQDEQWLDSENFLKQLRMVFAGPISSMTYSITSGFLAPAFCRLGEELARAIGSTIRRAGPYARAPEAVSVLLRNKGAISEDQIQSALSPYSGVTRHTAEALLRLHTGEIEKAEEAAHATSTLGAKPTWPAYRLGLHYWQKKDWPNALQWFETCISDGYDSAEQHAIFFRALAHMKLGDAPTAKLLAAKALEVTPFRHELKAITGEKAPIPQ